MSPDPQRTAAVSDGFNSTGARLVTVDGRELPLRGSAKATARSRPYL